MKVQIPHSMKRILTVAEMPQVREIQKQMKEDSYLTDYLRSAARVASGGNYNFSIYNESAQIAKNARIENYYSGNSGNLDIWLECLAFDIFGGAYLIGVYLSDVFSITGDNKAEIREHMFIKTYLPQQD